MQGRISEKSRQVYLDAMGIKTWFPRQILPNALPPRAFDFTGEEDAQPNHSSAVSLKDDVCQQPAPIGAIQAKSMLGIGEKNTPESTPVPQQPTVEKPTDTPSPAESESIPSQFRLVSLSPSDECLVVAEMPHSGLNQFSRFHQRLLNDILRALDIPVHHQNSEFSEFVWPLENLGLMAHMNMDDMAAADAVCAYLSNQFGLARRKVVLLFGQAAARFVIDPKRPFDELRGIQPGLHAEQWFATSHSLNELMKLPTLKSETWKDLSPLRKQMK